MAAPQQQQAAQASPIDNADVAHWSARWTDVLARPSEHLNSKSPESSQPWHAALFGCFAPIDTCLLSWCCPCVVFGRTHHRLHKSASLEGFQPVNTSCIFFCASACVPCGALVMNSLQRADLRTKHNLQGSCLSDLATTCCCGCCSLAQQDKEAEYREALLGGQGVQQAYQAPGGMSYPEKK